MKKQYAVINNNKLVHIVNVDSNSYEKDDIKILQKMFENEGFDVIKYNKEDSNLFTDSEFINDKFYTPRPFDSWILKNENWHPPKEYPNDGDLYFWDENSISWKPISNLDFKQI